MIATTVKWGGCFGLAAGLVQIPVLALGLASVDLRVANSLPFGFVEMVAILTISGLTLFIYAQAGMKTTRRTRRVILGVLSGIIAGVLTGAFIIAWTALLRQNAVLIYRALADKGAPPKGLPALDWPSIILFLAGYILVGAAIAFIGTRIALREMLQRRDRDIG